MPDQPSSQPTVKQMRRNMHRRYRQAGWTLGKDTSAVPLALILHRLAKKMGIAGQVWLTRLLETWPDIVGKPVAAHARPGSFDNGRLTIFVDSSVWLNELARYSRTRLLTALQARNPQIKDIILRLDPDLERPR